MLIGYIVVRFEGEEWYVCELWINVFEDELIL